MKKFILTFYLFIMAAGFCNAQFYIGGGIGAASRNNVSNDNLKNSNVRFDFAPKIGYQFNDKLLAGIEFGYNINTIRFPNSNSTTNEILKEKTNTFRIRPYIRYNFVTLGKFAFGAEAGAGYLKQQTKYNRDIEGTGFSLDIAPIITLSLNKHWWVETKLDIFGLRYDTVSMTSKINEQTNSIVNNDFSFGFDMNNLLTLGAIKLGVVYRF